MSRDAGHIVVVLARFFPKLLRPIILKKIDKYVGFLLSSLMRDHLHIA